ncbi:MAG: radical SAM protein [Lachnospiraceae bacterium]|nr:radical SAM protein [Lachnospiraceae bacterium]
MEKPFVKLVRTPNGYYCYDVNTNRIICVDKVQYEKLEEILIGNIKWDESLNTLKDSGYLCMSNIKKIEHPETENVEYYLERHINQLVLQLTQNCNLRCSYCAYSNENNKTQRNHTSKKMDIEIAKKAIDFMVCHSCDSKNVAIGFYGGEPLLEFKLVKDIIEYAEKQFLGKPISFTITTNGTLLTNEIFEYLVQHNVSVVVSVDGPKKIHDKNRVYISGQGSFETVYRNLNSIYHEYGEKCCDHISINMVVDPQNNIDEICSIFKESIFSKLNVRYTVVDDVYIDEKTTFSEEYIKKYRYKYFMMLLNYLSIIDGLDYEKIFENEKVRMEEDYNYFNKTYQGLPEVWSHSGPCIPGKRRLFVDIYGNLFPCERVSETSEIMNIGTLDKGFYYEKVKQILNVGKLTEKECSTCYAINKCTICARLADECGVLSAEKKKKHCELVKANMEQMIRKVLLEKELRKCY